MKNVLFIGIIIVFLATAGVVSAATVWYMPEGSTQTNPGGSEFSLWILVTNPNSSTAQIKYTFYSASGSIEYTDPDGVPANSRETLSVNWLSTQSGYESLQDSAISTKVECTNGLNIYAERAMYWDAGGATWGGGHTARGIAMSEAPFGDISQPSTFPITISQSGSYKLTSNLTVTDTDTHAIYITTSNVTIDLNGFSLTGPGFDAGDTGHGVFVDGESGAEIYNINIHNGNISSFRENGILLDHVRNFKIRDMHFYNNGEYGADCFVSYSGYVANCSFTSNGFSGTNSNCGGLDVYANTVVENNNFYNNNSIGITVGYRANVVKHNTISNTVSNSSISSAIYVSAGRSIIEKNVCYDNERYGIYANQAGTYVYRNVLANNDNYGIYAGSDCRIEDNHCTKNTDDIALVGDDNLCINNSIENPVDNAGDDDVSVANLINTDVD